MAGNQRKMRATGKRNQRAIRSSLRAMRDDTSQKEMGSRLECEPTVYRNHGDMHSYRMPRTSSICVGYIQAVGSHMVLETIRRCEPFRNGNHKELRASSLWKPRKMRAK